ncbi:DNA polymerase II [Arenicella sp. 4NH20-0111]
MVKFRTFTVILSKCFCPKRRFKTYPRMSETLQLGFLLTRSSRDRSGKIEIEYWVATPSGPVKLVISSEQSIFFISINQYAKAKELLSPLHPAVILKELQLKTFSGEQIIGVYCDSIKTTFQILDTLKHHSIEVFESDFRPHDRYLIERFVRGGLAFEGNTNRYDSHTEYHQTRVKSAAYTPSLTSLSLDIECALDGELFSVGLAGKLHHTDVRQVIMIGKPEPADTDIIWVNNERELILSLCNRIRHYDPDLITGWNLINFDLRILIGRARKHNLQLSIGRGGASASWRARHNDAQRGYVSIPGRVAIDGIDALKSATWSFSSFSLEQVAQTLLNRGKKVERDVDDRISEIVHNFHHDKPALAAYNLEDCVLVLDIFSHTKIIDYLVLRSQMTGLELDRAGGSVAAFTNLYLPQLHRGGYIAPNLPPSGGLTSPGGYVMESIPGLYKNVLVLDFKSLYPSIIRTFKVDPMGLIEGLTNPANSLPGFRGAKFDREKHFLPKIISDLWRQRDHAKKEGDSVRSQAIKIIMNSFYGVLGSGGCRFYDTRLASSITMRGHEIMQTTSRWIEDAGYTVIYGDTDSTFVALNEQLKPEECRRIGQELATMTNARWQETLATEYQIECLLEIEFETHFSRFLMPTIRGSDAGSKKRYAGLIVHAEQNSQGKNETIVFKGLENVRTDWTELARSFQGKLFDLVFHDQDPSEYVKSTVIETLTGQRDNDLVYSKQLRRKLDHYVKNVPPQVRAARIADEHNASTGKTLRYQNKGWISYLMTTNGPEPIEYHLSNIDYEHYVEKQLKPIADGILPFIGLDFDTLVGSQQQLF